MHTSRKSSCSRLSSCAQQFARLLLTLVLLLSVLLFVGYWFAISLSAWWESDRVKQAARHFGFPFLNDRVAHRRDKADRYLYFSLAKDLTLAVWVFWGTTLVAALAVLLLRTLSRGQATSARARKPSSKGLRSLVKRVMNHELPPMKFWWWWCGGLKTYDALIVAGYLIVNVLYVEQRYTLYLAGLLPALRKGHGELSGWNYQQSMFSTLGGVFAWAATPNIMLLFYPVPRSTFLHWMLGQNFQQLIKYHRWIGNWVMILLTLHGWFFWAAWIWEGAAGTSPYNRGMYWDTYGSNMLAGAVSWFAGATLWVTSLSYVRRNYFEVFYRTHIVAFVLFMLFAWMHHFMLWAYTMPGLALYLLDVVFRCAQQAYPVRLRLAETDPAGQLATLQVDVDRPTLRHPIQELYVANLRISPLQWHPFTFIPGKRPNTLRAIVKSYGRWSQHLMERLGRGGEIVVRMDGPYGEVEGTPAWVACPTLVIFAGGIGVTPVLGIIRDLNQRRKAAAKSGEECLPTRLHLMFSARAQNELALLEDDIVCEARQSGWLSLQLFLTGKAEAAKPMSYSDKQQRTENAPAKPHAPAPGASKHLVQSTLPPYHYGTLHWGLAHILAFAGAVLGGVAGWAFAQSARRWSSMGAPDWIIGLILFLASCVGCMLLPALIIVPAHLIRSICLRRKCAHGAEDGQDGLSETSSMADTEKAVRLPEPCRGRPDVAAILASICEQHAQEAEIGVIGAGPEKMVQQVHIACARHNSAIGLSGRPYLDASKYTYSL